MDTSPDPAERPLPSAGDRSSRRSVSFTIGAEASGSVPPAQRPAVTQPPQFAPLGEGAPPSRLPLLPRPKRPTFSRHRHDANPALAVKVLQDIQLAVAAWHQDLRETVQHIQALYMEGPMVDGWLETVEENAVASAYPDAALLRHGDPEDLSGYVDRLCQSAEAPSSPSAPGQSLARPGYRLCTLDSDGRVKHYPCPPEQVSALSLAIARHQKLRQLLDHKQFLEAKLKRTVELMTSSRDTLGIAPTCSSSPEEAPG